MDQNSQNQSAHIEKLSPEQMHHLVYNLFGPDCPIKVKQVNKEDCVKVPMFNLCSYMMQKIKEEGSAPLTETGALSIDWVKDIYSKGFYRDHWLDEQSVEPNSESDSESICLAHAVLIASGLCSDAGNKMQLTQLGHSALQDDQLLLETILFNYAMNIDWSALDAYGKHPAAQVGIGYVLLLLHQYGHEPHGIKFYSDQYYKAFPSLQGLFPSGLSISQEELAFRCFILRCIERFLLMFGMVEVKDGRMYQSLQLTEIR